VRLAIIEYVPLLASQLGVKFFDDKLATLCMSWLGDTVFSIREASTQNLKKLTEVFGVEWANRAIIPKVTDMGHDTNYLYRMTTCFAITVCADHVLDCLTNSSQTLAPVLTLTIIETSILPIMERLVADAIPNIRFNVAKTYAVLIGVLHKIPETGSVESCERDGVALQGCVRGSRIIEERILPNLEKLQQDDDVDVRYFSTTAAHGVEPAPDAMQV
jgi:serine/threonine-protein phosphatase 2A regulatory subunit A